MRAYHFTSALHTPMIFATGTLKRTESNASAARPHAGPDVVWLLDTPELGGLSHGLDTAAMRRGLGLGAVRDPNRPDKTEIRFTVEAPDRWTRPWTAWAALNVEPSWRDILVRAGGGEHAASHWWVCFQRIPRAAWLEVRNMHTGRVFTDAEIDAFADATVPTAGHLS